MSPLTFFKCLAEDTRLKSLLMIAQVNEACVCDLMEALQLDQPKTSRHLAELRKCGLLQDQRRGKWVYYRLHPDLPAWALNVLQETVQNNTDYIHAALQRIKSCQQQNGCC